MQVSERGAGDAEGAGLLPHLGLREHGGGGECGGPGGDHLGPGQHADAGPPGQGEDPGPGTPRHLLLHQIQVIQYTRILLTYIRYRSYSTVQCTSDIILQSISALWSRSRLKCTSCEPFSHKLIGIC